MQLSENAVKLSISLDARLFHALDRASDGEPTRLIQQVLAEYCVERHLLTPEDETRYRLMWKLVGAVVKAAQTLARDGQFAPSITEDAIQVCLKDGVWHDDYAAFVMDNPYKHGNPLKGQINREFGFQVKKALGAKIKLGENGRPLTDKVIGSVIQSYTQLFPDA